MKAHWLFICFLGAFLTAIVPESQAANMEEKGIQGHWVAEKCVISGRERGKEEETTVIIDAESVSWTNTKKMGDDVIRSTITFTYKLDPAKKPAEIDLTSTDDFLKGKVFPSIYKIDGDTLQICRSQPDQKRPTEFTSKDGTDHWLLILKRAVPK